MRYLLYVLTSCIILFWTSCANYKVNYGATEKDWQKVPTVSDNLRPVYTLYLMGDAGEAEEGDMPAAVRYFNKMLKKADKNSAALLLGDNISPNGMPPSDSSAARLEAEYDINMQLNGLRKDNFKGRPLIMMGDKDWKQADPIQGLERQEKYINDYLNAKKQVVYPEVSCGGPEAIELTDDLVIIAIDSQWWIKDWNKVRGINDGCISNSRESFMQYFEDAITDYKNKNIIIALHHPPHTNGPHGGYYSALSHIFPLRSIHKDLWLPLPGIGTMVNTARSSVGNSTDVSHPRYTSLSEEIVTLAEKHSNVIFVSAHEHSLQYFELNQQKFIVTGSGTKATPVRAGNGAVFAAGKPGFAVLKAYQDGSIWMEFHTPLRAGVTGEMIYRKKIKEALPLEKVNTDSLFVEPDERQRESFRASVYPSSFLKFTAGKKVVGAFNSELYFTELFAPPLYLDEHLGGLEILRPGGSTQTNSLRVRDKNGQVYALRSLRKDATRSLPSNVNFALSQKVMQYFITGSNPFGGLAIPPLAEAANIYHTNPELYYLPKQAALGIYNEKYGNQLYLIEARPDDSWAGKEVFGGAENFISFRKLFEKIRKEDDKLVKVNQKLTLRNRLFDLVIGDFDRHLDQFRFAEEENRDSLYYNPIPRDRDVAFSKWDGLIYECAAVLNPFMRANEDYGKEIKSIKWLIYQSRGFDENFLNELTWEDWEREAKIMQHNLTDARIEYAVSQLPQPIYDVVAQRMIEGLKSRRDQLVEHAQTFYTILNKRPQIIGTDQEDLFEIERLADGLTQVTAWTTNDSLEKVKQFYQRTFHPDITKEIRIFGLDEDDTFKVTGKVEKGIKVRLIGGYEEDTFIDESSVKGLSKKTIINDSKTGNHLQLGTESKDNTSDLNTLNTFLYFKNELYVDHFIPNISGGFNQDDGVFLGMQVIWNTYPFRKHFQQQLSGNGAFRTGAFNFNYKADFQYIFNTNWNLILDAGISGPQFSRNYFGLGNGSPLLPDVDRAFNRVRLENFHFKPALKKEFFKNSYFSAGLLLEKVEVEETEGRILAAEIENIDPRLFEENFFTGITADLSFDFVDSDINPANGIRFDLGSNWRINLKDTERHFAQFKSSLTFYQGWGEPRRLVFATKVGFEQNIGEFEFYQVGTLGGSNNLRGYRIDRFAGARTFYQNTDLRLRVLSNKTFVVPFSLGILAGFDYGRVWTDMEESERWHYGVGGGVWVSPLDIVVLNVGYFVSREEGRLELRAGYLF